jgi:hypothetical protein
LGFILLYPSFPPIKTAMKKILIALICFSSVVVRSQDFEGIITWKFSQEMDAATKAKMDEAQKKMNDPATQAQMKEMREKMNDPEFKKMMESNPQMKAQLEQMLKMAESGETNSLMPKSMVLKIKGYNSLSMMEGGVLGNYEILSLKDKKSYKLDRKAKTYSVMPIAEDSGKFDNVKITKTNETKTILNYPCIKYIAESTIQGQPFRQILWATTAIKGLDLKQLAQNNSGDSQQALFFEKIDGVPLRVEIKQPQFSMAIEAVSVERKSLPASDFSIPGDFKETKY